MSFMFGGKKSKISTPALNGNVSTEKKSMNPYCCARYYVEHCEESKDMK